jgi:hypothetical protein
MRVTKAILWTAGILAALWVGTHWKEILSQLEGRGVMPAIEEKLRSSENHPPSEPSFLKAHDFDS